jgi:dolichol-phosphate mannosyltransferase
MKTLILIPTYNERENVENLISEIVKLEPNFYVLVVDDSSCDGTAEILDRNAQANPRVLVIHRSGKRGRGISGREGFKRALQEKPDYIIEMDADFSHDPKYIPVFLEAIENCDVVIGSRFVKGAKVLGRQILRNYLSWWAQFFSKAILGLKIADATSGFRCFKRYVLESLDWDELISWGPAIVEEMNYHIEKKGFKIKEIPILFYPRAAGHSKLNIIKVLDVFCTLVRARLS